MYQNIKSMNIKLEKSLIEQTIAKNEAEKSKKIAEEANSVKSRFLDMISHELRTPIHSIAGFNQQLLKNKEISRFSEISKILSMSASSIRRLSAAILDILAVQEINKKADICLSEFSLKEIFEDISLLLTQYIGLKPIKFSIQINFDRDAVIKSDKNRLFQAIDKIVKNAALYTENGEINLIADISEQKLFFTVSDTGIGISPQNIQKIFEPFVQVDQLLTRKVQGLGIGLSVFKNNIEALGGEFSIKSEQGKGTEIKFSIPIEVIKEKNISEEHDSSDISKEELLKNKRILYCDDDPFNLAFLEMILKPKVQYESVDTGQKAIEKSKFSKYDLIFMDIQMPGMDGIETMNKIKNIDLNNKTPIVALTAQAMPGDRERFLNQGFFDYISKPVQEDIINSYLLTLFNLKKF